MSVDVVADVLARAAERSAEWPAPERVIPALDAHAWWVQAISGATSRWPTTPRAARQMARALHDLALDLGLDAGRAALTSHARQLARFADLPSEGGGALADALQLSPGDAHRLPSEPWLAPIVWCEDIKLVERGRLAAAGRVARRLYGRDLATWILAMELATAVGGDDDWRLSDERAAELLRAREGTSHPDPRIGASWDEDLLPYRVLDRMARLGVTTVRWSDDETRYTWALTRAGAEQLEALSNPSARVRALSRDIADLSRDATLQDPLAPAPPEAAARSVRLLAHEVRNALLPAQVALDGLVASAADEVARGQSETAQRSVRRALTSVREVVEAYDAAVPPHVVIVVGELLREVQLASNGMAPETDAAAVAQLSVAGVLRRLVLALVNLVRNAHQAGPHRVVIRGERTDARILLHVDDDGPGVPEAIRARIWDDGFTTRREGLGIGLAAVRDIIEREHRGRVSVGTSPEGGARFTVDLPIREQAT